MGGWQLFVDTAKQVGLLIPACAYQLLHQVLASLHPLPACSPYVCGLSLPSIIVHTHTTHTPHPASLVDVDRLLHVCGLSRCPQLGEL